MKKSTATAAANTTEVRPSVAPPAATLVNTPEPEEAAEAVDLYFRKMSRVALLISFRSPGMTAS